MKLIKDRIPFTQVANEVLASKHLSWKAKGLYAYLFSKPDDWDFSSNRMIMESRDGRDAIMSALRELEDNGYLSRKKRPDGKMDYQLKYSTLSGESRLRVDEPKSDFPTVAKSHSGTLQPISNIDNTNKEGGESNAARPQTASEEEGDGSEIEPEDARYDKKPTIGSKVKEVLRAFEEIDAKNKAYVVNKTQRSACEFLLNEYGMEKIKLAIEIIKSKRGSIGFPSITSPWEMKEKWSKIPEALMREKNEGLKKVKNYNVAFA